MIFFLLPSVYANIYKYIHPQIGNDTEDEETTLVTAENMNNISNSLTYYLNNIKIKLNNYEKEWDVYKKYTNPFEYINSIIPHKNYTISKYKPLSRSYFKMIELLNYFKLLTVQEYRTINTFHLAEGPGGFIEAIVNYRNCTQDKYIGMTIVDDKYDENIPAWKKSDKFLKRHSNVTTENGADGTGNILSVENFIYCKNKYKSSMDLITADGGFDFSNDYNNQEKSIIQLLFAQIAFALCMQKKGGIFILKIFDCFTEPTIDMLYILSSFYEEVYITKPQTSRYANSEKYVVCKRFRFDSCNDFFPHLYECFLKIAMISPYNDIANEPQYRMVIKRFLTIAIPYYFVTRLEEFNAIFGEQQIENIHNTILLIESKYKTNKIDNLLKTNLQKCINWCSKNNIKHNNV